MILENIPQELKALPQWVLWKAEIRDGKTTKIPYCPREPKRKAEANNPATWGAYEEATAISKTNGFAGIGYEFSVDDPFTGIDLDKCRDAETGVIEPWARKIIDRLASYTEISPSGSGVHILTKGKLLSGGNHKGKVEMYSQGQYFTMTGQHLEGTPATIEDRQGELEALHREVFGASRSPQATTTRCTPTLDLSDQELLDRAHQAANGSKFVALWRGDCGGYPSQSEADLALCEMMVFWTGPDPARIDRLFRQSGSPPPSGSSATRNGGAKTCIPITIWMAGNIGPWALPSPAPSSLTGLGWRGRQRWQG